MQCSFPAQSFPRRSLQLLLLLLPLLLVSAACPKPLSHLDPQTKAYLSPIVFAGKLTALSGQATTKAEFTVDRLLKGPPGFSSTPVIIVEYAKSGIRKRTAERRPRCQGYRALEGELRTGEKYVVFAAWRRQRRVIAMAGPEPYSKRKVVAKVLCTNCAKAPTAKNLKDIKIDMSSKLKLKCKISGNPPPRVTWFKDGLRVKADGRIKVRSKRRYSHLAINSVTFGDGGKYECFANNVLGNATASATVFINTTSDWVFKKAPCPNNNFCLNGGMCSYFETVREYVCECAEGFRGQRCESKAASIYSIGFYLEE